MNRVHATLMSLLTVGGSSNLHAIYYHDYYEQTQPSHIPSCVHFHTNNTTTPKPTASGYHGFMLEIARNPQLGYNHELIQQLLEYTKHCWTNEKQDIFVALASNPSLMISTQLVNALTHHTNSCWSQEKHTIMKTLAHNHYIGNNEDAINACIQYLNSCWSSDRKEILMIFAANPSTCHNYTLTAMLQKEMERQKDLQKAEAIVTIGIGTAFLTAAFINWCCSSNTSHRTTHYYAH